MSKNQNSIKIIPFPIYEKIIDSVQFNETIRSKKTIEPIQQELVLAHKRGDRIGEETLLAALGEACLGYGGDYEKAREFYHRALVLSRVRRDKKSEAKWLAKLGDIDKEIQHIKQALAIAREIGDKKDEIKYLDQLGDAYHYGYVPDRDPLDLKREGNQCYEQALAIAKEIGDLDAENFILNLKRAAYFYPS